jgi:hypothetical protein
MEQAAPQTFFTLRRFLTRPEVFAASHLAIVPRIVVPVAETIQ